MAKPRFAAVALACLLAASACGKKGTILVPLTLVPQGVESLTALQRGGLVVLEWKNPAAYIDGRPMEAAEVEIWLEEKIDPPPVPSAGAAAPAAAKPAPAPASDFATRAKKIATLAVGVRPPAKGQGAAPPAKGKRAAAPAPAPAPAGPPNAAYVHRLDPQAWDKRTLAFALRVRDARKSRLSSFSPEVRVRPQALAAPPEAPKATVFADRVEIRWAMPEANFDGSTPPRVRGFNVYREDAGGGVRRLNAAPVTELVFADRDAAFGRTYRYFVRAAGASAEPFLESEDSAVLEVLPKDIFPPAVPAGLTAAQGPDFITLVWDAVPDADAAGYHVWRREKGKTEFKRLTTAPVPEPTYTDQSVEKNVTYEYAITCVDTSGNESAKSAVVEETIKTPRP